MESLDADELTDLELDGFLKKWNTSPPPPGLRKAIIAPRRPWRLALALVFVFATGRWSVGRQQSVVREPVLIPVVNGPQATRLQCGDTDPSDLRELRQVMELRPRIIRSTDAIH